MLQKMRVVLARLAGSTLVLALFAAPAAAGGFPETASAQASSITDKRVTESSSLAISDRYDGVAYTANDEHKPIVYAIDIRSGQVVGTTQLNVSKLGDPEALAIDRKGTLWLADLGDNFENRSDTAIYAFPEAGPGKCTAKAVRYPITYSDNRSHNVETLLVNPVSGAKYLVSKVRDKGGTLFALPASLKPDVPNVAKDLGKPMPKRVSDGTFTPDGARALIRDESRIYVLNPRSWTIVQTVTAPRVLQGESVAFEPGELAFLTGSEGNPSPLIWVGFDQSTELVETQ